LEETLRKYERLIEVFTWLVIERLKEKGVSEEKLKSLQSLPVEDWTKEVLRLLRS